MEYVEEQ
ncbi:Protein of unknown function [Bacillus mycoides]|nr:Protein of unknown function [Bacillus mycoides]